MKPLCFVLDSAADTATPKAILSGEWRCERVNNTEHFQRIYLDSLDWRLLQDNLSLFADRQGNEVRLCLFDLQDNQPIIQIPARQLPAFAGDLPEGELTAMLPSILRQRALLPHIQLAVTRHPMVVLDGKGATVARLDLEISKLHSKEDARPTRQDRRLWFVPIKGYEKQNRAVINALSNVGLPLASAVIPVRDLITTLGIDTARFDTRPTIQFTAADRCDNVLKHLLDFCLSVMEANRPGVITDIDTECLHDLRVAVRRSRSLLGQARGVINDARLERAKAFFSRLSEVTNLHRDLDVLLLKFDDYRSSLPQQAQGRLDSLYTGIMAQRRDAAEKTVHFLQSSNYQRFVEGWKKYLETPVARRTNLPKAAKPVKSLADTRIWKAYKRVVTRGGAINDNSPPEALHALRKDCKTLRYLMEFFNPLYPAKKLKHSLNILKRLQDKLGEFQDYHIHIDLLEETRSALTESKLLEGDAGETITILIRTLDEHQSDCRKRFHKRFLDFSSERHQHLFKRLFRK